MSMTRVVVCKWECGACNELHDHEHEAEQCCAPDVSRCWVCPACDRAYSAKKDAEDCCPDKDIDITCPSCIRNHARNTLSYHAVRIAGHCTDCNPMYTIDQQQAVQDLHYRATGSRAHLFD